MKTEYYNAFHTPNELELAMNIEVTWAGYFHCDPNYSCIREYGRNDYMLLYIIEGMGWYQTEDGLKYIVEGGSLIFFKPNEYQNIKCDHKNPWVLYGIHFRGETMDSFIKGNLLSNGNSSLFYIGANNHLITLFEALIREISLNTSGNYAIIIGLTIQILGEIDKSLYQNVKYDQFNYLISEKINRAIEYMNLNYNKKLSLEDIASKSGYSVSRFVYLFKKYYKMSPIDFLLHERIEKAKKIIEITNLSVAEIGYSVGFNDPLYFSKVFKERVGISPKKYRNSINHEYIQFLD